MKVLEQIKAGGCFEFKNSKYIKVDKSSVLSAIIYEELDEVEICVEFDTGKISLIESHRIVIEL